ncbi:LOW QUALITY PROTEIN: hypothetical protein RJ640_023928 [Escallonia rubra]|uniref:CCHC-type domain-containing protein n=1 Tax=Escallonia rubra TaxID=112253 RepID=A0AA88U1U8_9ASTE|nr:LOW QUALITY PROTEIN: hypothetical protein RJ640_023928 [Escallonia rubra]
MKFMLKEQELEEHLTKEMVAPTEAQPLRDHTAYQKWNQKDRSARYTLLSSLQNDLIGQYDELPTCKALWEQLKFSFGGTSTTRLRSLVIKFEEYTKDPKHTMSEHLRVMSNMIGKLRDAGHALTDEQQVRAVIRSLPASWANMKQILTHSENIKNFSDHVILEAETRDADKTLTYVAQEGSRNANGKRGRQSKKGKRGEASTSAPKEGKIKKRKRGKRGGKKDLSKVKCFNCQQKGHFARDCTEPKKMCLICMKYEPKMLGEGITSVMELASWVKESQPQLSESLPIVGVVDMKMLKVRWYIIRHGVSFQLCSETPKAECQHEQCLSKTGETRAEFVASQKIGNVRGNTKDGSVLPSIGNLSFLVSLDLSNNSFRGHLPDELDRLQRLEGLLPSFIGQTLPKLEQLLLGGNELTGKLNPLNGTLPVSIGNLSSSLEKISVAGCGIKGTMLNEIGNLGSLTYLSLFANDLIGATLMTVKGMQKLQALDLSSNKIQGTLPQVLCYLSDLIILYLDVNELFGPVPTCLGNVTSLRYLYLGYNKLNSSMPASFGNLENLLRVQHDFKFLGRLSTL